MTVSTTHLERRRCGSHPVGGPAARAAIHPAGPDPRWLHRRRRRPSDHRPVSHGKGTQWSVGDGTERPAPGILLHVRLHARLSFSTFDNLPCMFRVTKDDGQVTYRTGLFARCQIGAGGERPDGHWRGRLVDLDGVKGCSAVIDPGRIRALRRARVSGAQLGGRGRILVLRAGSTTWSSTNCTLGSAASGPGPSEMPWICSITSRD